MTTQFFDDNFSVGYVDFMLKAASKMVYSELVRGFVFDQAC